MQPVFAICWYLAQSRQSSIHIPASESSQRISDDFRSFSEFVEALPRTATADGEMHSTRTPLFPVASLLGKWAVHRKSPGHPDHASE